MAKRGETIDDIEAWYAERTSASTRRGGRLVEWPSEHMTWLDEEFSAGLGAPGGPAFVVWTKKSIYFSYAYDGSEYVESVPRHPSPETVDPVS